MVPLVEMGGSRAEGVATGRGMRITRPEAGNTRAETVDTRGEAGANRPEAGVTGCEVGVTRPACFAAIRRSGEAARRFV